METQDVLDLYVREVAEQLPPRQRADVSLELRELLREDLEASVLQRDRPLDAAQTLEFLHRFDHPREVAWPCGINPLGPSWRPPTLVAF